MGKYSNKVNKKHRRNVTFKKYGGGELTPEQKEELQERVKRLEYRQNLRQQLDEKMQNQLNNNAGVMQKSSSPPTTDSQLTSSITTTDSQPISPPPTTDTQSTSSITTTTDPQLTPTLPNTPNVDPVDKNNKDVSTSIPDNNPINTNAVIQSTKQIPASNVSGQNIFDVTTVGNLDANIKNMLLQTESTPIPDETNVYKLDFTKIMSNKFVLSINGKYLVINKKIQTPTPVVP